MRIKIILGAVVMFAFLVPMVCFGITNGDFCGGSTGWSQDIGPSSSVSFYPSPLCYVQVLGYRNERAVIWQQETAFGSGETWRATFTVSSVSTGLGAIVTLGWSDISGDYASYYQEITSPGTYTVDCDNSSYPFVSVQCDGGSLTNAVVVVNEIATAELVSPTPTPTATPITLPGQYTFNSSLEGWSFLPISGPNFSGASSGYSSGRVSINSASGSTNRVGLWNGPNNIPYVADNVYRAQFTASSSQATASQNPQFRMRWTQDLSLESTSQVVNAAGSYSYSLPTDPTTKQYSCYFAPILSGSLGVAFDMLDFDAGQYGTHYVDEIALDRFSSPAAGTAVKTYTSAGDFSNWQFLTGIGGYGSVTSGGGGTGTLTITASTPGNANFGWWQSDGTANELTYVASRLYRATYTLRCASESARNTMPQIRLRCQNEDGQMTQTMELNSQGTGPGSMPAVAGTDYDLYWETPNLPGSPSATEDGFIVTIDVLDFDTSKGGTIYMDSVAVDHVAIP
jgi:hypothetical protein